MLDLGLTKMALFGFVALVVLGPERLPRVARTAGALFGRAQRYINDVKAEVTYEIELDELRRMKTEFESAARNVENTIHDTLRKQEAELNDAWITNTGASVNPGIAGGAMGRNAGAGDNTSWRSTMAGAAKRKNWRVKQTATPTWYKRATARHTRATLRHTKRFY
jgi:sec-independent protein translocase protein TatB